MSKCPPSYIPFFIVYSHAFLRNAFCFPQPPWGTRLISHCISIIKSEYSSSTANQRSWLSRGGDFRSCCSLFSTVRHLSLSSIYMPLQVVPQGIVFPGGWKIPCLGQVINFQSVIFSKPCRADRCIIPDIYVCSSPRCHVGEPHNLHVLLGQGPCVGYIRHVQKSCTASHSRTYLRIYLI